jgi:hypothetical protein
MQITQCGSFLLGCSRCIGPPWRTCGSTGVCMRRPPGDFPSRGRRARCVRCDAKGQTLANPHPWLPPLQHPTQHGSATRGRRASHSQSVISFGRDFDCVQPLSDTFSEPSSLNNRFLLNVRIDPISIPKRKESKSYPRSDNIFR